MRLPLVTLPLLLVSMSAFAVPTETKTVTLDAANKPVVEVLKQIAETSGETVLVEKLVGGTVTANVKELTAEDAIDAITKASRLQWRRIYVLQGSSLAKDADALAAQMRTVLALRFPDIIIGQEGSGGSFMHVQKATAANELTKTVPASAGMVAVYLVTDDAKAYKKDLADASKKKVAGYIDEQKKMMNTFIEMTPEERMAALKEGMAMSSQVSPELMQEMMSSMTELDPQYLSDVSKRAVTAMMNLPPESRKKLLKQQMTQQQESMKSMSPEQMKQLNEEMQEIAKEMQAEASNQ